MGAAKRRREALGVAYGMPPVIAWHYTLGRKIPRILRDGALRDAWMDRNRRDFGSRAPYSIWLTTAGTVDPTSNPAINFREGYGCDPEAFKRMAGGHWRIGFELPHPALMTYAEALALNPPGTPFGAFYRNLAPLGENRKDWRIASASLPLAGCRIEELQGGEWIAHPLNSLSRDEAGPGYGLPGLPEGDASLQEAAAALGPPERHRKAVASLR